jgi:hypothetical protein
VKISMPYSCHTAIFRKAVVCYFVTGVNLLLSEKITKICYLHVTVRVSVPGIFNLLRPGSLTGTSDVIRALFLLYGCNPVLDIDLPCVSSCITTDKTPWYCSAF